MTTTEAQRKSIERAESIGFRTHCQVGLGLDVKTAAARDERRKSLEQATLKKANTIFAAIKESYPGLKSPYAA